MLTVHCLVSFIALAESPHGFRPSPGQLDAALGEPNNCLHILTQYHTSRFPQIFPVFSLWPKPFLSHKYSYVKKQKPDLKKQTAPCAAKALQQAMA